MTKDTAVRERRASRRHTKVELRQGLDGWEKEARLLDPWFAHRSELESEFYWCWKEEEYEHEQEELRARFCETVLAAAALLQSVARSSLSPLNLWSVSDGLDAVAQELHLAQELFARIG